MYMSWVRRKSAQARIRIGCVGVDATPSAAAPHPPITCSYGATNEIADGGVNNTFLGDQAQKHETATRIIIARAHLDTHHDPKSSIEYLYDMCVYVYIYESYHENIDYSQGPWVVFERLDILQLK